MKKRLAALAVFAAVLGLSPGAARAQQTGSIEGKVTLPDGSPVAGVAVRATSDVLPLPRTATTTATGEYRLPLLPPGDYEITFTLGDLAPRTERVQVLLQQTAIEDVTLSPEAIAEEIQVTAEAPAIDPTSSELKTAIAKEVIDALPVGQEYRDLVKLIPGVQYSEDTVRGPSAGGSGQDNAYLFDGVNVALPLFGTLSAEPSSHDIDQIAIVTGGANAVDFNRAGGFTINSVSKSGTNRFHGQASYQIQPESATSKQKDSTLSTFEEDKDWAVLSLGGPVVRDRLFFYGSYYRPTSKKNNSANAYGPVPDFKSTRDEGFGKLSYTPLENLSIQGSFRDSSREDETASVGGFAAASTAQGQKATLGIAIAEGSWILSDRSFASFKLTDFENKTSARPDTRFSFQPALGQRLDIANLDQQGFINVPLPIAGQTAYNQFIGPLIARYGFTQNGVRTGGGQVGGGSSITNDDFFRKSYQVSWNYLFGQKVSQEVHLGYQWSRDEEDLQRTSNGWGSITVPGGRTSFGGRPVFFEAAIDQMGLAGAGGVPVIHSELVSHNIEINDQIRLANWTFNAGVVASKDTFYGQGLRAVGGNLSGFALAPGHKYKMYDIDFGDMIQPRLGATWAYNGKDTIYANFARYNPAASSLPRAASWDRNLVRTIRVFFAADGSFIGSDPLGSSSGKFFDDGLDPRRVDEYLLGTSRQLSARWTGRAHARYRYANNFWEDTNNNARIAFNPPAGIPRELYVPNLAQVQSEIGGSSYVIAELDGAFSKYYEVSAETEWRSAKAYFRGSYTWSHYYGNFDQDNTTTENDQAIFVGSSNIADGAGRQLWDKKYGNLRGDRRHQLKLYGSYQLPWHASAGAFAVYQSGQPWEVWDVEVYRALTTSTSDVDRNAEPAGSRTTDSHYQIDLNYTQDFRFGRYSFQLRGDLFNATNNQTGYNIQNQKSLAGFGKPRSFFDPRRFQLGVKFEF
ncbi:MAG TPA: carboxypeptidase regulatory-like domain-containing protein [Thermoanaerobaculia bacterium]|nr:carboxypeptidase regulatory-like domain-containing protein [Thermoanaerobaculia bacterium]